MKKSLLLIMMMLCLSGCGQKPAEAGWATPQPVSALDGGYVNATQTAALLSTTAESATPQADARLKPEAWRSWPVVPEVTDTARTIYRKGLEMGTNPKAFSKVGDCQNLHEYFLGRFDNLDIYQFAWDIEPYRDTVENFTGYFDTDGQAARFGFTAASPLSPLQADLEVCLPDETPLECELRLTRPGFVLISLEFPFNGRTPELYERYLRQIIEYTISQGAVPILATKADNVEKDYSINRTVAELAYEYDLPMWNWWAAAQPLGDHGIDPYRDGFHISQQAWEERSKTFLKTLDHLWKGLREN
jgi:hypothetical protein